MKGAVGSNVEEASQRNKHTQTNTNIHSSPVQSYKSKLAPRHRFPDLNFRHLSSFPVYPHPPSHVRQHILYPRSSFKDLRVLYSSYFWFFRATYFRDLNIYIYGAPVNEYVTHELALRKGSIPLNRRNKVKNNITAFPYSSYTRCN